MIKFHFRSGFSSWSKHYETMICSNMPQNTAVSDGTARSLHGLLFWASIHSAVRRLTAKSCQVSEPRDSALLFKSLGNLTGASAAALPRCLLHFKAVHYNIQSRGYETSRYLAVLLKTSVGLVNRGSVDRLSGLLSLENSGQHIV